MNSPTLQSCSEKGEKDPEVEESEDEEFDYIEDDLERRGEMLYFT